jgi:site-specific DNA-cytosine methylase
MSKLFSLLCDAVAARSGDNEVAVLLSGGIDGLSVALALQKAGKAIRAYTYEVDGYVSEDRPKAEAIARHFEWPLTVVTVPTSDLANDFVRLAVQNRCLKKTHFEVLWPLLYILPAIKESEIWSGWNADDHFGNTKNDMFRYARMAQEGRASAEMKEAFDQQRRDMFSDLDNPDSSDNWWLVHRHAAQLGKRLLDPYLDKAIRQYFLQFDHDELSPLRKPHVRNALANEIGGLAAGSIAVGVRLQIGGRVNSLFETLLDESRINRFEKKYTRVSDLCRRWAKEVSCNPEALHKELENIKSAPAPATSLAIPPATIKPQEPICAYAMSDVHKASAASRFTAISMFAGGGGSSIGYRLAGGRVLIASEFVPEAARTYTTNFPETVVDPRDIREIASDPLQFIAQAGVRPGKLDVLDGSPPCCEFSVAGTGIHDQTVMRPYSDVKQRGIAGLIFQFMSVATGVSPKIVVAENVPPLAGKYRSILDRALHRLRFPEGEPGPRAYYASHSVLAADDFGVPQNRRRLFIIAIRADVGQAVGVADDAGVASCFPDPTHSAVTVRQALVGLRQTDPDVRPFRMAAMGTQLGELIRQFPKDPPRRLGHGDVVPESRCWKFKRAAWDQPSFTLTVTGQQPDGASGVVHPVEDRKFTLPELKRLTGLPDDYKLTGTLSQAVERVCRMVPPPLTRAIAERIYDRVLRPYAESRA